MADTAQLPGKQRILIIEDQFISTIIPDKSNVYIFSKFIGEKWGVSHA